MIDAEYLAYAKGQAHAKAEFLLGNTHPQENPLDGEEDIRTLAFNVTGRKLDPESEEAQDIALGYETGYFEQWEAQIEA